MTMVSYGYFGDLMRHSERLRWLGKYRYDVSGVRTFLAHRSYHGTLTYTEAAPASSPASDYCGQVVEYPPRVAAQLTGLPAGLPRLHGGRCSGAGGVGASPPADGPLPGGHLRHAVVQLPAHAARHVPGRPHR